MTSHAHICLVLRVFIVRIHATQLGHVVVIEFFLQFSDKQNKDELMPNLSSTFGYFSNAENTDKIIGLPVRILRQ